MEPSYSKMPFPLNAMPPTPAPSIGSPPQQNGNASVQILTGLSENSSLFHQSTAGPSRQPPIATSIMYLPPTPPTYADKDTPHMDDLVQHAAALQFSEPVVPQRVRRGRRPASVYPVSEEQAYHPQPQRKYTDPTPRGSPFIESSPDQQLIDLDAYSAEYDRDVDLEPTLSFDTASTVASTTGTPSIANYYKSDQVDCNSEMEPRIRVRTTAGRSNAYSSAESSFASGAYSYHAMDHPVYHPHPPPLPIKTQVFALAVDHVGLGISGHDFARQRASTANSQSSQAISPTSSFAHRPWRRDVVDRYRSDSASSSITTASLSTTDDVPVSAIPEHALSYPNYLSWNPEQRDETEPVAVAMVDEGRENVLNFERLKVMGGVEALTEEVIRTLTGITHLLLPGCGSGILSALPRLLVVFAPTLVVIDISDNDLSFLPEELQNCTLVEELNVSSNPLRILPGWMGELIGIRVLVIDGCLLQGMPQELSHMVSLHTLCARRNRLVALPSWLCLLCQLETLRVDDNPLAPEWLSIVAPILLPRCDDLSIPTRGTSHGLHDTFQSASFSASVRSSLTGSSSRGEFATSVSAPSVLNETWISPPNSATQSAFGLSGLGAIAEDQPHSAPLYGQSQTANAFSTRLSPEISQNGLRKMSSVGDILGRASQPLDGSKPVRPGISGMSSRATSIAIGLDEEINSAAPKAPTMATSASKLGKWGFLRKMSTNKLRPDKSNPLTTSASTKLKVLPPPLKHADSDPTRAVPTRPTMQTAHSVMTLPTTRIFGETNEFGQAQGSVASTTLPISGSMYSGSNGAFLSTRGKRRSFLPIDGPPSINIAIPSTSPFMPVAAAFAIEPLSSARSEETIADNSMTVSASGQLPASPDEVETRYSMGLESIKSYLRDLYDLSRPAIEPYGGFEVVNTAENSYASAPSERPMTPATGNCRRPTLESQLSRNTSSASAQPSERASSVEVEGKSFKNDKGKRARVVREIYETERTYVRGLGELVSIYVRPAGQSIGKGEPAIPLAERKVVFGGVESILTIHRDNLLPALERAVRCLLEEGDDETGNRSAQAAHQVGEVFRTYIAYMKQYSTYINNFDNALARMKNWSSSSTSVSARSPTSSVSSAAVSMGLGLSAVSVPPESSTIIMSASQKKRVTTFLKRCREHPMHSQINLESYLLLPIQRVPRYKLLLEDLATCTPTRVEGPRDTLDDALTEIASLASLMNEEKRDAESRLRLFHWQQRITSRGPSPLVQPHRKLILDGALDLIRLVKKASSFVEVDNSVFSDGEATITSSRAVVPVEFIAPEPMDRPMMLILCTDLLVLVQQRGEGWDGQVDLFNVLRMATLREPASLVRGNVLRVVDNKSIYYFNGGSASATLEWCRAINSARRK